jgi:hypothetical protein
VNAVSSCYRRHRHQEFHVRPGRDHLLRDGQIGDRQEHRARLVGRESHRHVSTLLPYLEEFRVSDQPDDVVGGLWRARHIHLKRLPDEIDVLEVPPQKVSFTIAALSALGRSRPSNVRPARSGVSMTRK